MAELNRGMAAWGVGHKELICPKCSSALPVSAKLPNAVFETPKDDWGTRVPRDLETAATCLYVEEVPSPKSSAVPMVIRQGRPRTSEAERRPRRVWQGLGQRGGRRGEPHTTLSFAR
ncbi:unnamed protein product [Effrenium voratum]|nr:unnamed protein product [Effrenium voratum]